MSTEFAVPSWCSICEVHLATPWNPLCPSCAAEKAREIREQSKRESA